MPLLADLLDDAIQALTNAELSFGHGSDNPSDEAIHLVLWATELKPESLNDLLDSNATVPEDAANKATGIIRQRIATREPAAYLTGTAWLGGEAFRADRRALVPRSLIVEVLHDDLAEQLSTLGCVPESALTDAWPARVLDLCCGSASIGIHAAKMFQKAQVLASDLSADALALAKENLSLHQLTSRIELVESDLYSAIDEKPFDLILCNPPYVNDGSMSELPKEFLAEPDLALRGGADGMNLIRTIISEAPRHLKPDGVLVLEIGHEANYFEAAFEQLSFSYLPVAAGDMMVVATSREQIVSFSKSVAA